MGIQERDYYLDRLRKRTSYEEKARFRVPASQESARTDSPEPSGGEYLEGMEPPGLRGARVHWSLKLVLLLLVFVTLLALRRVAKG